MNRVVPLSGNYGLGKHFGETKKNMIYAGPYGAPGHNFLCPSFLWLQEQPSFQPLWPPLSSNAQIHAVVNQGREGCEARKKESRAALDKVLFPYQWIHTTISLSYFADVEAASRWEKLTINDSMLPTSLETQGQLDSKADSIYLTTKPSEERPWVDHILFEQLL